MLKNWGFDVHYGRFVVVVDDDVTRTSERFMARQRNWADEEEAEDHWERGADG